MLTALKLMGIAIAVVGGCAGAMGPNEDDPDVALSFHHRNGITVTIPIVEIQPPADYLRWFIHASQCSGLAGNYNGIKWYLTPQAWPGAAGDRTFGFFMPADSAHQFDRIILNAPERMDSGLVAHEVLHHLLNYAGWQPGDSTRSAMHPSPPFGVCSWGRIAGPVKAAP